MLIRSSWLRVLFKYLVSKYPGNLFYQLLRVGITISDHNYGFVHVSLQFYPLLLHVFNVPRMMGFSRLASRNGSYSQLMYAEHCFLNSLFRLFFAPPPRFLMSICWSVLRWEGFKLDLQSSRSVELSSLQFYFLCEIHLPCTLSILFLTQGVHQARPGIPILPETWKLS